MTQEAFANFMDADLFLRRRILLGLGGTTVVGWLAGCGGGSPTKGVDSAGAQELPNSTGDEGTKDQVLATAARTFAHPGLLHTDSDFARMKGKVGQRVQPWLDGWNALLASGRARIDSNTRPNPLETVVRGADGENHHTMVEDLRRAYQFALRWKVSGDTVYADMAVRFLDAWSHTLKRIEGSNDKYIVAGLYGYQWANSAEIMRTYSGWPAAGLERFQRMMLDVFYPLCREFRTKWTSFDGDGAIGPWASWPLLTTCGLMSVGILCDRVDIYDEAVSYYKSGRASGSALHSVYAMHPGYLGQWQESGRDSGHCTLSIGLVGMLCEMAWNQGDDLYGYLNNRVLAAAEYVAQSNLADADGDPYAMPFVPFATSGGIATAVADQKSPNRRGVWEVIYNHYVNRKGIAAPWVSAMAAKMRPEADQWVGDEPDFGTMTFSRDPGTTSSRPSGLTALIVGGRVVLSWWGVAGAKTYNVKRATSLDGEYQTVATVSEPRTYSDAPGVGNWFYAISANVSSAESAASNRKAVTLPGSMRLNVPFSEGKGDFATDIAGRRTVALAAGASWGEGRRPDSRALVLDGKGGHVVLPAGLTADLSDFTLAAWVHLENNATDARIVDIGADDISYLALVPCSAEGRLKFVVSGSSFRGEQSVSAPTSLPTRRWVHVAFRLAGTTGTLFVDGSPVQSNTELTYAPHNIVVADKAWVGRSQYSHPTLNGRVQDLRLYVGALDSAKLAELSK